MARFSLELPLEIIRDIEDIDQNAERMMNEMLVGGAEAVYEEVEKNLQKTFKTTKSLRKGLKITKVYRVGHDDSFNIKVGFYGYDPESKPTPRHPKGTPIALIALAREYGTSSGEKKRPFLRPAFNKTKITDVMLKVQKKYIPED